MNKKRVFVSFAAIALVLGACFSPWKGDEGTFSVSIGGQSRAAWNDTGTLEELTHTITLSDGPGPEQTRENVKYGDTVHFSVTPGRWIITITAFLDGIEHATGSRVVSIKPGPNGAITIKMEPINPGETDLITVTNGNDDGEGSLRWAMLSSPEVATIIIKRDVKTITLNSTLPPLSFEDGIKTITIKAESDVTIKRGSGCLDQLFTVGKGGTLILGGNGSASITIDGDNIDARTSLIDLGGPGTFIMNDGVTLQNNKNDGSNGGGGVYVSNGGTFIMNGGKIFGNSATNSGDGVYVFLGTFIISGGEISSMGNGAVDIGDAGNAQYGILNAAGTELAEVKGTLVHVNNAIKVVNGIWTFDVENKDQWDTACEEIRIGNNGNNYAINVTGEGFAVDASSDSKPTFGWNKNITITGKKGSSGNIPIITLKPGAYGSLLYIVGTPPFKQIVTIENITLQGHSSNNASLVKVDSGGNFIMNKDSTITGNKNTSTNGGGVYVYEGNFTMNDNSKVSDNEAASGGGVFVDSEKFIMNDNSEVSGNAATNSGGGVYIKEATFLISGGTVKTNTAGSGAALYVKNGSNFAKYGTEETMWTDFELTGNDENLYDKNITVVNGELE